MTTPAGAGSTTVPGARRQVDGVSALGVPLHVTGSIDEPGGVADHPVDLARGQLVYLRGSGDCGVQVEYQLLTPAGSPLTGAPFVCNDHDRVAAPDAGTYTVQVRSWNGGTGPYDLEVVPVPPDDVVESAVGSPMVGELTVAGEHDEFTFAGTAGDIVYLDGAGACGVSIDYVLLSPSQQELSGAPYVCDDIGRQVLPQTGTYTVAVRSYAGGTGPYDVAVLSVPPDTDAYVTVGDRLQGELTAPGEEHYYVFDAGAGDVVALDGEGPCGVDVTYVLLSPDAVELSGELFACEDSEPIELPQAGTYFVVVSSWEGGTGPYAILLRAGSTLVPD